MASPSSEGDEMNERPHPISQLSHHPLPFDWRPAIDRLHGEAEAARAEGKSDPYAEIEAECWIDLIDAELAAQKRPDQSRPEVARAMYELRNWRAELQDILEQLATAETKASSTTYTWTPAFRTVYARAS
jgi:hypothetical protein